MSAESPRSLRRHAEPGGPGGRLSLPHGRDAGWEASRLTGEAQSLHARPLPEPARRSVWVLEATRPALVLGSAQKPGLVDPAVARDRGVDVARRRSGGGAVLVGPGDPLWVDLVLPAGDPLWDDDVARAAYWVGEAWSAALAEIGVGPGEVHRGPLACGRLGRLVCFATVGAGEVTVGGRKVVGISQRRTRAAARFQCALYRSWQPELLADLLGLGPDGRAEVAATATGTGHDHAEVLDAFLRRLSLAG